MTGAAEAARLKAVNPPFQFDWTDDRVDTLKRLWTKGDTATDIAAALGEGCTRNSVLGKASRLKLGKRGEQVRTRSSRATGGGRNAGGMAFKIARARQEHPDAKSMVEVIASMRSGDPAGQKFLNGPAWVALPGTTPKTLVDLMSGECKWPIGDAPILFCAAKAEGNYCPDHQRMSVTAK